MSNQTHTDLLNQLKAAQATVVALHGDDCESGLGDLLTVLHGVEQGLQAQAKAMPQLSESARDFAHAVNPLIGQCWPADTMGNCRNVLWFLRAFETTDGEPLDDYSNHGQSLIYEALIQALEFEESYMAPRSAEHDEALGDRLQRLTTEEA